MMYVYDNDDDDDDGVDDDGVGYDDVDLVVVVHYSLYIHI